MPRGLKTGVFGSKLKKPKSPKKPPPKPRKVKRPHSIRKGK